MYHKPVDTTPIHHHGFCEEAMRSFIHSTFIECLLYITIFFFQAESNNVSQHPYYFFFLKTHSGARKMRCFTKGCGRTFENAKCIQGEIIINCNTKPIVLICLCVQFSIDVSVQEFLFHKFMGRCHLTLFFSNQLTSESCWIFQNRSPTSDLLNQNL